MGIEHLVWGRGSGVLGCGSEGWGGVALNTSLDLAREEWAVKTDLLETP